MRLAAALVSCLALGGWVAAAQPAGAVTDTTAPQLSTLSFSPASSFNISDADQTLTVQVRATDDSSGVASGCIDFDKPSTTIEYTGACFTAANRISGTALNGVYNFTVTFKQYSHTGVYPVGFLSLTDVAGNVTAYPGALLQLAGLPSAVSLNGVSDVTAPTLVSLSLSNTSADLADGAFTTTVTAHVTDAQSGYFSGCLEFGSPQIPSGNAYGVCLEEPFERISGTSLDGVYQATLTIPQTASPGTYPLVSFQPQDRVENFTMLAPAALEAVGAPAAITLTNRNDTVPLAPTSPVATTANHGATVSWSAPLSDGGAPVLHYIVTATPGGQTTTVASSVTSTNVTGLTNGTAYTFTVHATNGVGDSAESAPSNAITPAAPPDAPTNVVAVAGPAQAQVSWTPSAFDGGLPITGYRVVETPADDFGCGPAGPICQTATVGPNATSATVTGLENGKGYTFTVHATNAIGNGPESATSNQITTPAGVPTGASAISGIAGGHQALLQWLKPVNDGGSPLTGYTVTANPGGLQQTFAPNFSPTGAFTGLTNGVSYTFSVHATNAFGDGPESDPSDPIMPYGPANAPTAVHATAGNGSATISWTAPSDNGSAIYGYNVTASPGGAQTGTFMPPSTTVTMTGLTNGTAYTFTVFANNGAGSGPSSAPSPAVTVGAPVAPPTASAVSSDTKAVVSWTAPANNGSPITGYVVTPVVGFFTLAPQTFNTTGTTATVTGLTNGTTYRFLVAAKNVRGAGATTLSGPVKVGAPVAPATAAGTAGNGSVAVAWSASPNPAGSPVTGYVVTPIVGFVPLTAQTFAAAATSGTVTGLTNGTTYRFSVAAKNAVGTGPNVITGPIIAGVPGAATAVGVASGSTATTTGPLTVSYGAGANNGAAITLFTATCTSSNGGVTRSATHTGPTAGPITVTGATTGKSYTCAVATANSRGTGAASAGSAVVVVGAPARPNVPTVVKSASGAIRVTFSAPANNGAAISGYSATCQSTNGGVTASKTGTASPLNVTGLTTGKSYTCTVVATNARGAGPVSAASAAVTA